MNNKEGSAGDCYQPDDLKWYQSFRYNNQNLKFFTHKIILDITSSTFRKLRGIIFSPEPILFQKESQILSRSSHITINDNRLKFFVQLRS